MKTYTGEYVNLTNTDGSTINPADIAWGLGRIIRFNGQIAVDYTVAHHCLVMSHLVDGEHALEALMHDAAEAYMGDIIWPVKAALDEKTDGLVSRFENDFLCEIVRAVCPHDDKLSVWRACESGTYVKSDAIREADIRMGQHEWATLDRGPEFSEDEEIARVMEFVNETYEEDYLYAQPWWAWLRRFHELTGTEYVYEDYVKTYFPKEVLSEQEALRKEADEQREVIGLPAMTDEEWEQVMEQADLMSRNLLEDNEELKEAVL
jgi:5'-deoxynucleotidase YfbR-like HD superfamily hydrolase